MLYFDLLKKIFDAKKIAQEVISLVKKYPFFVVSFLTLVLPLSYLISFSIQDDSHYDVALKRKVIKGIIIDALDRKCRDNVGITIIAVSVNPQSTLNGTAYAGVFEYAYVYEDGKIINKIDESNTNENPYTKKLFIPLEFAQLLKTQSLKGEPQYINAKFVDAMPDFVSKLLQISKWFRDGKMESFYTDVVIKRDNIIYIITFATTKTSLNCSYETIKDIFNDLKSNLI